MTNQPEISRRSDARARNDHLPQPVCGIEPQAQWHVGEPRPMLDDADRPAFRCAVTFRLWAECHEPSASVVGEFNEWAPGVHVFAPDANGGFSATVPIAVGCRYRYRYLLEGERWENDWNADDYEPNESGGYDSVLDLTETSPRILKPVGGGASVRSAAHAEPQPLLVRSHGGAATQAMSRARSRATGWSLQTGDL